MPDTNRQEQGLCYLCHTLIYSKPEGKFFVRMPNFVVRFPLMVEKHVAQHFPSRRSSCQTGHRIQSSTCCRISFAAFGVPCAVLLPDHGAPGDFPEARQMLIYSPELQLLSRVPFAKPGLAVFLLFSIDISALHGMLVAILKDRDA